jgi:hypothetical protein
VVLQEKKKEIEEKDVTIQDLTQKNAELASRITEIESTIEGIKQEQEKKVQKVTLQCEALVAKKEDEVKLLSQKLEETNSTFEDYKLKAYAALKEVEIAKKKFEEEEKGQLLKEIEDLKTKAKELLQVKKELEEARLHSLQIEQELLQLSTQHEAFVQKCKETENAFVEKEAKSSTLISTLKNELRVLEQDLAEVQSSEKALKEQVDRIVKENQISTENFTAFEQEKAAEIADLNEAIKVRKLVMKINICRNSKPDS